MAINSTGINNILIEREWPDFKKVLDGTEKRLTINFEETTSRYDIFSVDNIIVYSTIIFKAGFEPGGWTQTQIDNNTTYRTDFTTNYQSGGNKQGQDNLLETSGAVQKRFDIGTTAIYVGYADRGALASAAVWTIKKIDLSAGLPTQLRWTSEKTAIWNNRTTETYS